MSLTTNKEVETLFNALASSGAYMDLYSFFTKTADAEKKKLTELAVGSLAKPELRDTAMMQLGRSMMLDELISFMRQFIK